MVPTIRWLSHFRGSKPCSLRKPQFSGYFWASVDIRGASKKVDTVDRSIDSCMVPQPPPVHTCGCYSQARCQAMRTDVFLLRVHMLKTRFVCCRGCGTTHIHNRAHTLPRRNKPNSRWYSMTPKLSPLRTETPSETPPEVPYGKPPPCGILVGRARPHSPARETERLLVRIALHCCLASSVDSSQSI